MTAVKCSALIGVSEGGQWLEVGKQESVRGIHGFRGF